MATPEVESTADATPATPADRAERGWRPYRLSVRQYLKMIAAGVFPDHARLELMGGLLIQDTDRYRASLRRRRGPDPTDGPAGGSMTKGGWHNYSALALSSRLRRLIGDEWLIAEEKSLFLGPRSRPEPDIAVLRGPVELYRDRDPAGPDAALIVEVAESSYRQDRGAKWRSYAAARVPIYWIVRIAKRRVEVYRDPAGRGATAAYQTAEVYNADAAVPVVIAGVEVGRIAVADILP